MVLDLLEFLLERYVPARISHPFTERFRIHPGPGLRPCRESAVPFGAGRSGGELVREIWVIVVQLDMQFVAALLLALLLGGNAQAGDCVLVTAGVPIADGRAQLAQFWRIVGCGGWQPCLDLIESRQATSGIEQLLGCVDGPGEHVPATGPRQFGEPDAVAAEQAVDSVPSLSHLLESGKIIREIGESGEYGRERFVVCGSADADMRPPLYEFCSSEARPQHHEYRFDIGGVGRRSTVHCAADQQGLRVPLRGRRQTAPDPPAAGQMVVENLSRAIQARGLVSVHVGKANLTQPQCGQLALNLLSLMRARANML
ncbi:MAG: hypothetical protein ACLQFR_31115, partial [Streptosporangiaceae bacterium]